jgi:hypothetical protein
VAGAHDGRRLDTNRPIAIAVTVDGGILIATFGDSRIRFVDTGLS